MGVYLRAQERLSLGENLFCELFKGFGSRGSIASLCFSWLSQRVTAAATNEWIQGRSKERKKKVGRVGAIALSVWPEEELGDSCRSAVAGEES